MIKRAVRGATDAEIRPRWIGVPTESSTEQTDGEEARHPVIEVVNVSKHYRTRRGSVQALGGVSMTVQDGEFVSLLGPSGCGKSTLLLIIAGLTTSTNGTVSLGGRVVDGPQTDIGIVFQRPVLLDWRTSLANIMLQPEIRRLSKATFRARALDLLESVGLKGFEGAYPHELSGGMQQRVALCRGLIHDPRLLLMDEPFGALDAFTRDALSLDLQTLLERRRKTVVFVTHSISEAVLLSDRVVVMSPRPGMVDQVIEIDVPRPRGLDVRETQQFGLYTRVIREIFESRGVYSGMTSVATDEHWT